MSLGTILLLHIWVEQLYFTTIVYSENCVFHGLKGLNYKVEFSRRTFNHQTQVSAFIFQEDSCSKVLEVVRIYH